ncbi:predicted protein [Lodderomyces elongisporus NRRL YB-4239]|uniref:Uncharacterized protein n=1 Tax=Lodderomyces elongisporus (strain ATCC 11503 / CBS 2605 / JCM 1781 / NBRC 1676 / NRRL YB-4239) TaxID=379508 RepID=A5E3Y6_LODEL|nr:predicted protein [Lodderomyces elongisporus NRRL YB-4239]
MRHNNNNNNINNNINNNNNNNTKSNRLHSSSNNKNNNNNNVKLRLLSFGKISNNRNISKFHSSSIRCNHLRPDCNFNKHNSHRYQDLNKPQLLKHLTRKTLMLCLRDNKYRNSRTMLINKRC